MKVLSKKAFSLIEVSIVVLIISIIIAGVTQSSVLIQKMRLSSARSQTQSSAVPSISGLSLWYETTLEESYQNFEEPDNEDYVTIWRDINPQSSVKNNAQVSGTSTGPKYIADCLNALPCLNFTTNDHLDYDGRFLVGTNYSIFVVERRNAADGGHSEEKQYFITGETSSLRLGYRGDTTMKIIHSSSDGINFSVDSFATTGAITQIHYFTLDADNGGRKYYLNGDEKNSSGNSASYDASSYIPVYEDATVGGSSSENYIGDIFEVIIYNRSLRDAEISSVHEYLSRKWGVELD